MLTLTDDNWTKTAIDERGLHCIQRSGDSTSSSFLRQFLPIQGVSKQTRITFQEDTRGTDFIGIEFTVFTSSFCRESCGREHAGIRRTVDFRG